MKLGIISDTHDNVENILKAVELFNKENIDIMIHTGDIVAPATVKFFKGIEAERIIFVKGNCDGDLEHIKEQVKDLGGEFHEASVEIDVDEKLLGAVHGDDKSRLEGMINSKRFDYIIHGHTHQQRDENIGKTRIINPGAHYYHSDNSVAIVQVETDDVAFKNLK